MDVNIREYQLADREGCLMAFKSNVPLFFTSEEVGFFTNFLDTFYDKVTDIKTYFFVVLVDNKIIGCGGFGDKDNTQTISLAWGLIHKDFHKKGYGEKLLKYRLERIQKFYPANPLVIDTTQFSVGFFEKYGFEITKYTPDFYEKGMHRYDLIFKGK